ncbi:MAG: ATP synthase F1 subunit delta [Bacteroidetes bacterium]|nr:ATP synthase F1 subunit delta [Bacteroidota bacterium]
MPETKVAGRYAKSLLGLAVERKSEKRINDDMQLIANTIDSSKELNNLLKNPIINADKKETIVTALFGSKIDAVTLSFLKIIINKKENFI